MWPKRSRQREAHAISLWVVPECNSVGVGLLGGIPLEQVLGDESSSGRDLVIVVENDLYRRVGSETAGRFIERCGHLVVVDHLMHETAKRAELILPASTFAEGTGTMVNNEGQGGNGFFRVLSPSDDVRDSWHHLGDPMIQAARSGGDSNGNLDGILQAIAESHPQLEGVTQIAPGAQFRMVHQKIPRQPHRYSGRTSMHANVSVHEPKPPDDEDSPLSFSMEGYPGMAPAALTPRFRAPGWNSIQSLNKFQSEIAGPLVGGDPGIRLLESSDGNEWPYFSVPASTAIPGNDLWLLVPAHHVFGSEELSLLSPGIRQLTPDPYVGMNSEDAASIGIEDGGAVSLEADGIRVDRPVQIRTDIPRNILSWPVGIPGNEPMELPRWVSISLRSSDKREGM